jgi:hypothetical protein
MKLLGLLVGAIAILAIPLNAQASLPRTTNTLIVPNRSIGGVVLGAHRSQVIRAWGPNSECVTDCIYQAAVSRPGVGAAVASALLEKKREGAPYRVWTVFIAVGLNTVGNKSIPNFKTPLTKFKTAKGIGLGSKLSALKKAYHGLKRYGSPGGYSFYQLKGKGESETGFTISPSKKITQIVVRSHPGG